MLTPKCPKGAHGQDDLLPPVLVAHDLAQQSERAGDPSKAQANDSSQGDQRLDVLRRCAQEADDGNDEGAHEVAGASSSEVREESEYDGPDEDAHKGHGSQL